MPGWWNGRHKGLKIPRPQGCAGSSPAPGTNLQLRTLHTTLCSIIKMKHTPTKYFLALQTILCFASAFCIEQNSYALPIRQCQELNNEYICLSSNFEYEYSFSKLDIIKEDIKIIDFNGCFIYTTPLSPATVCKDYTVNNSNAEITVKPKNKQFFTSIDLNYIDRKNNFIEKKISNGYCLFSNTFVQNTFWKNWETTKEHRKNFKIENKALRVLAPEKNPYAKMTFKHQFINSFRAILTVAATNNKKSPAPIFVINEELFIYFAKNGDSITIDYPQALKKPRAVIKIINGNSHDIELTKNGNSFQINIDNVNIFKDDNSLQYREWSSFEMRVAYESESYLITNFSIQGD